MSALSGIDIALWYVLPRRRSQSSTDITGISKAKSSASLSGNCWEERSERDVMSMDGTSHHCAARECALTSRVGGDRPSDVLEQAKVRKAQGFTRVKMNATESIGWLDSPHALDETVQRLADIKAIGMDAGL